MKNKLFALLITLAMGFNAISHVAIAAPIESENGLIPKSIPLGERFTETEKTKSEPSEILTVEFLPDIQQSHFKDIQSDDEVDYDGGVFFVKNQLLLMSYENISYAAIENLTSELNAEIVGYIPLADIYQFEFIIDYKTKI